MLRYLIRPHLLLLLTLGCASLPSDLTLPTADAIYVGDVVTMNPSNDVAEALAIKNGLILAVGDQSSVMDHSGMGTTVIQLGNAALLPGFVDPHSHFLLHGVPFSGFANVSRPPVGRIESAADVIAELKRMAKQKKLQKGQWLIAYGYEKEAFADQKEMTVDDLEPHFPDNPVVMIHVSSHGAVLNAAAFKAVGIDAFTPTPPGGLIVRKADGLEPAGLIMETPFFDLMRALPAGDEEQTLQAMHAAQLHYAANGYTTIQDGATSGLGVAMLQRAAEEGRLFLDVISLPTMDVFPKLVGKPGITFGGPYRGRLKFGGVKSVTDGSPQGRTAYWTEPMLVTGPGGEKNWRGQPIVPQAALNEIFRLAYANGVQTYTHSNADAAIDMFLAAHLAAGAPEGRRPVIIHSQFIRPDQLDAYVNIGAVPSFFSNHAFFWGDVHLVNLGAPRANFLSPLRSATDRGLHFTNHSDYGVTPLDPLFMLWTATERTSRSGRVIGETERVSVAEALRAITIDAAYQYFEEDTKGSLEPGKLADLVILESNPLDASGEQLRDISILETIKEGTTVWKAEPASH